MKYPEKHKLSEHLGTWKGDMPERPKDYYIELQEKYNVLLEFIKKMASLNSTDEHIEQEKYCGDIDWAFDVIVARKLLMEIGEL